MPTMTPGEVALFAGAIALCVQAVSVSAVALLVFYLAGREEGSGGDDV